MIYIINKYNIFGCNEFGLDKNRFFANGLYKTELLYDFEGYDINEYNFYGHDRFGYNAQDECYQKELLKFDNDEASLNEELDEKNILRMSRIRH